jgi:2-oxoglutarate ferredoxin oxidoreductase subunit gamma
MSKTEVLLAGLGGQGVQLAGDLLAKACTQAGRQVSVLPSYGAEARGTLIRAEVVISDEKILYPGVLEPDIFVAFSQEAYDRFAPTLSDETSVIYDSASVTPPAGNRRQVRHYAVAAMEAASEAGNAKAANMVMLGAIAAHSQMIPVEVLKEMLSEGPASRAQTSTRALEMGFELAKEQLEER